MRLFKGWKRDRSRARHEPGRSRMSGLEAIGLTTTDVMRTMAATFALNAIFVLLAPLFGLAILNSVEVRVLAAVALGCSVIWHVLSKHELNSLWLHIPTVASYAIYLSGGMIVGEARGAFAIILISAAIATATMMSNPSFWIYTPVAIGAILIGIDHEAEPLYWVRAAALTVILILMVTVATINRRAQVSLVARNKNLADIDPLTGLGNVRVLRERLKTEARHAVEGNHEIAIISLDVARFSSVNQNYGRSVGDEFLRRIASSISDSIKPADVVVRVRADGFGVMVLLDGVRDVHAIKIEIAESVARIGRQLTPSLRPSATVAHVLRRTNEPIDLFLHRAIDNHAVVRAKSGPHESSARGALTSDVVLGGLATTAYQPTAEETTVETKLDTRNPWFMAVATTAVTGALPLVAGLLGVQAFSSLTCQLAALALLSLACLGSGMTRENAGHPLLLPGYTFVSLILLTTIVAAAGSAGSAILDFYLLPTLFLMYTATPNQRSSWMIGGVMVGASMVLYAYFLNRSGYPFTTERTFITIQMLLVDGMLFASQEARIRRLQLDGESLLGRDEETGLANLRRLHERIDSEIARRDLLGGTFGVILIEMDRPNTGSTDVNDPQAMLVAAARAMDASAPPGALCARRGEREFTLVVSTEVLGDLRAQGQRISQLIVSQSRSKPPVTISWGCAMWRARESRDDLLRRADNSVKRNRVANGNNVDTANNKTGDAELVGAA